ncbi:MAG: hypothetical protein N2652_09425 [Kiritimatiellae bacterium]|nr:hypothetical protein [Kiritimatiellia bacterium]
MGLCRVGAVGLCALVAAAEGGGRPYELDWAGRTNDFWPPLEDFEATGRTWQVECRDALARFERVEEPGLWGARVGRLTYRGTGPGAEVRVVADPPLVLTGGFDAVTVWCYGNTWGWRRDPTTPNVSIFAMLRDLEGRAHEVPLGIVNWQEWHLLHRRLNAAQLNALRDGGVMLGLRIAGGTNTADRWLAFDHLGVHREAFPPLKFATRPARNLSPWPGQNLGLNTGPGRLPFPTTPTTIAPTNLTPEFSVRVVAEDRTAVFTYEGADGRLVWRVEPAEGTWSGIIATWQGRRADGAAGDPVRVRPCVGGGVRLVSASTAEVPDSVVWLSGDLAGGVWTQRWQLCGRSHTQEVVYAFTLLAKSLAVDVLAPGGGVAEVVAGEVEGPPGARLVTLPYYPAAGGRPAIAVFGRADARVFAAVHVDWYRSNASQMWAPAPPAESDGRALHGGVRYRPRTDGRRNDVVERFVLAVSPQFEEVLPTIPNPPSPWKAVTGSRVWRAHGASADRSRDRAFWARMHRLGITEMVVTDHETMWRDGGESFTFRTRTAPGKGGDEAQAAYTRFMIDELGYRYGPYNNFTDLAPVNEYFSPDMVARGPDLDWQRAWFRCYAPKPARAVEFCERLAPEIQRKFRFNTAYCDVHTAVAPWDRVDYDARVPGAGTMAATFYAYGEIMLQQKAAWNGPVYSEGGYHAFYAGLTDGNYAQDQHYRPAENPWLVDFDLRRIHPLQCDFGMGNPEMFYAQRGARTREDPAWLDRFLAATVAFGHSGFLVTEGGERAALRSYCMTLPLHRRYCTADAVDILYADAAGRFEPTSRAIASGGYRRSQVAVRYSDGTCVVVNGHRSERLRGVVFGRQVDLPPNGWVGWTEDGSVEVFAGEQRGVRCDYAADPDLLYLDGRGGFVRFPRVAGTGPALCRRVGEGEWEAVMPFGGEAGFAVSATRAVALDAERRPLGPAEVRRARGLAWIVPVAGAVSYRLEHDPGESPEVEEPSADRTEVVPGERVRARCGGRDLEIAIPSDAAPGAHLWYPVDRGWLEFLVVAPFELAVRLEDARTLLVQVAYQGPGAIDAVLGLGEEHRRLRLRPEHTGEARFDLGEPRQQGWKAVPIEIASGAWRFRTNAVWIAERVHRRLAALPPRMTTAMRLRGRPEMAVEMDSGARAEWAEELSCGGQVLDGLFMHPPYRGGVGAVVARFAPIELPVRPAASLRGLVGKRDGSDPGDGILFRVEVENEDGSPSGVAELWVDRHEWRSFEADLSGWAGRRVRLNLVADVGPRDNSAGDWACWADLRIETREPELVRRLATRPDQMEREPATPLGKPVALLRTAAAGWLVYEGKGFEGTGRYESRAELNGVDLGPMRPAHGNELAGSFSAPVRLPLPPAAIATLGVRNRLRVWSPGGDWFSLRRFRIELEWSDGSRAASDTAAATWSQPPEWPHAEGLRVPAGRAIELDLWFDAVE